MPRFNRHNKIKQGFTVVELIVAVVLFALVVTTFISLVSSVQYNQRITQYFDLAKNAATSQMEKVRSNPSLLVEGETNFTADLPVGLPTGSTGKVLISPAADVAEMKKVTVEVTFMYPVGSSIKKVKISSLVGESGIVN